MLPEIRELKNDEIVAKKGKIYIMCVNCDDYFNGNSLIKWQNQKLKLIKRMYHNCHISYLIQVFSDEKMVD